MAYLKTECRDVENNEINVTGILKMSNLNKMATLIWKTNMYIRCYQNKWGNKSKEIWKHKDDNIDICTYKKSVKIFKLHNFMK